MHSRGTIVSNDSKSTKWSFLSKIGGVILITSTISYLTISGLHVLKSKDLSNKEDYIKEINSQIVKLDERYNLLNHELKQQADKEYKLAQIKEELEDAEIKIKNINIENEKLIKNNNEFKEMNRVEDENFKSKQENLRNLAIEAEMLEKRINDSKDQLVKIQILNNDVKKLEQEKFKLTEEKLKLIADKTLLESYIQEHAISEGKLKEIDNQIKQIRQKYQEFGEFQQKLNLSNYNKSLESR